MAIISPTKKVWLIEQFFPPIDRSRDRDRYDRKRPLTSPDNRGLPDKRHRYATEEWDKKGREEKIDKVLRKREFETRFVKISIRHLVSAL